MGDQVLEERRKRRQAAADGRCLRALGFAHEPFPRDDGAMVHLAQLAGRADAKGPHEVRHIFKPLSLSSKQRASLRIQEIQEF